MKEIKISRPVELVAGSGLDLRATVATFGNPKIESEIALSTDSTKVTATISTIIDLAVT